MSINELQVIESLADFPGVTVWERSEFKVVFVLPNNRVVTMLKVPKWRASIGEAHWVYEASVSRNPYTSYSTTLEWLYEEPLNRTIRTTEDFKSLIKEALYIK